LFSFEVGPVFRLIAGVSRVQVQMTRQNIQDRMPLISTPFFTLVAVAILKNGGREDLASYGVVAPLLMTVAWMGIYIASEVVNNDRNGQTLELLIATPAPYFAILITRVTILCSIGLIAFAESWLIARVADPLAI
jgi:ABC-2 type transport system permease protein